MTEDLFAAAAEDRLARQAPLAARLRPKNLDEVVGQDDDASLDAGYDEVVFSTTRSLG